MNTDTRIPTDKHSHIHSFLLSFIHSGDLYSASSRPYYSEALNAHRYIHTCTQTHACIPPRMYTVPQTSASTQTHACKQTHACTAYRQRMHTDIRMHIDKHLYTDTPMHTDTHDIVHNQSWRGGSLVDSLPFVRRVAGSNPALAATY